MGSTTDPALTPPKAPPPSITEVDQYNDGIPSTEFTVRINTSSTGSIRRDWRGKAMAQPSCAHVPELFPFNGPSIKEINFCNL